MKLPILYIFAPELLIDTHNDPFEKRYPLPEAIFDGAISELAPVFKLGTFSTGFTSVDWNSLQLTAWCNYRTDN